MDRDLFEHPGFYLVAKTADGTISHDGVHSSPEGVAKAKHLFDQLGFSKRYVSFRMMEVRQHPCPEPSDRGVDHGAVRACRGMIDRFRGGEHEPIAGQSHPVPRLTVPRPTMRRTQANGTDGA